MKKDLLENIEETREKRKLTKEAKKKIRARLRANFFVFLSIALLIIAYVCIREYLPYEIATCTYDICAVVCLLFNIILVEVAYRKNSVKLIVTGMEICAVSVFSLFSTYVYYKLDYITISLGIICASAVYYIIKIIVISITDRRKYLYEMSDFSEIIRKESKDKNAVYEQENRMKMAMEERKKLMENMGNTHEETENKTTNNIFRRGRRKKTETVPEEPIVHIEQTESKKEKKPTRTAVKKNSTPTQIKEEPIVKKTTRGRKASTVKEEVIEEKPKAKKTTTTKTKKDVEEAKPKTKKTTTTTKKATTSTKKTATKTTTATKKPVAKTSTAKKTTTKRTTKK